MSLPAAAERRGSAGSAASLVGLLHFEDPALLRGVRLTDVLRNCGQVFTSSAGTAETYSLSSRVDRIDVFVSHNWAVGRVRKFAMLLFYFNLDMTIASMIVTNIIVCPVLYAASLRTCAVDWLSRGPCGEDWGFIPTTASCTLLAFCTTLFLGHRAKEMLGLRSERVFVDKICISQIDDEAKSQGIRNLGAFLHHSSNLLVCFTGLYLKKLWTVYEFATFLLLRKGNTSGVHVMPAGLPPLVMLLTVASWAGMVLNRVVISIATTGPGGASGRLVYWVSWIVGALLISTLVLAVRVWARQEREARTMFENFRFDDAVCTAESDRARVRQNILQLMRHCTLDDAATDQDALLWFDDFVRTAGLHAFQASVGALGCPYRFLLPVCLLFFSDGAGFLCFRPQKQPPAWQWVLEFTSQAVGAFAAIPLMAALCFHLTKCCLRLRGICEVAYCGAVFVLAFVTLLFAHPGLILERLKWAALYSPSTLAGVFYYFHIAGVSIAAAVVYRPPRSASPTLAAREDGGPQSKEVGGADDAPVEAFN